MSGFLLLLSFLLLSLRLVLPLSLAAPARSAETLSVKSSLMCGVQTFPACHFSSSPCFLSSPLHPPSPPAHTSLHSSSFRTDISFSHRCVCPPLISSLFLLSSPQWREGSVCWNKAHVPPCKRWHLRGRGLWRSNEEGHCSFPTSNCLALISDPAEQPHSGSSLPIPAQKNKRVYTDAYVNTHTHTYLYVRSL